uniref:Ovule protein n=1 Tax=Brugia pahangi TaxID=6280 RepID=A0A0N4T4X9_BRUPA
MAMMKTIANKNDTVEFSSKLCSVINSEKTCTIKSFHSENIRHLSLCYMKISYRGNCVLNAKGQLKTVILLCLIRGIGRWLLTTTEGITEGRKGRNKSIVCSCAALGSLTIDQGL